MYVFVPLREAPTNMSKFEIGHSSMSQEETSTNSPPTKVGGLSEVISYVAPVSQVFSPQSSSSIFGHLKGQPCI